MRRAMLIGLAAASLTGCGFLIWNSQETVVQSDLRLPRGTRIAVIPISLFNYQPEQVSSLTSNTFSVLSSPLLKQGFHVVERSLVEKAILDYGKTKSVTALGGASTVVYQDAASSEEKVVDVVDIGRTLNVRLVLAGSLQASSKFMSAAADVRLRVVDVLNGELIAHCQGEGKPSVVDVCAEKIAGELATKMVR